MVSAAYWSTSVSQGRQQLPCRQCCRCGDARGRQRHRGPCMDPCPGPVPAAAPPRRRLRAPGRERWCRWCGRGRHLLHTRVFAHALHTFFLLGCWVLLCLTGYSSSENSSRSAQGWAGGQERAGTWCGVFTAARILPQGKALQFLPPGSCLQRTKRNTSVLIF